MDLVGFFLRRMFSLLKTSGFLSIITTNTISQGDTREGGLVKILAMGGCINFAIPMQQWPGKAAVNVSLMSIKRGAFAESPILNGKLVKQITPYLDSDANLPPNTLKSNEDVSFVGSFICGSGFLVSPDEAHAIIDTDPKYKDVLFPYLNGQDVTTSPLQAASRWVINFHDWTLEKAAEYEQCYNLVNDLVLPVRTEKKDDGTFKLRKPLPQKWWIYADKRPKLYARLSTLKQTLVVPETAKYCAFSMVKTGIVLSSMLKVITLDDYGAFALLSSAFHNEWTWKYSATLETRLKYSPSDCFVNYPFPPSRGILTEIGERYHEHREATMILLWLGLTKIYNFFHDPELNVEKVEKVSGKPADIAQQGYEALLKLRELHVEMDTAVRDAYGWTELDLEHGFHDLDYLPENDRTRYTISPAARKEVLQRLLKLNHERHAEEKTAGLHDKKKPKAKAAKKKAKKTDPDQSGLDLGI